jgi:hypothetical protein
MVQSQPGQIVHKILSKKQNKTKKPSQNKGGGGRVGQGVGPDFNPSTSKKKKGYCCDWKSSWGDLQLQRGRRGRSHLYQMHSLSNLLPHPKHIQIKS